MTQGTFELSLFWFESYQCFNWSSSRYFDAFHLLGIGCLFIPQKVKEYADTSSVEIDRNDHFLFAWNFSYCKASKDCLVLVKC